MADHSPTPWKKGDEYPEYHETLLDTNDRFVANFRRDEAGEEDVRRVIACVNACVGIETAELEAAGLDRFRETECQESVRLINELIKAREILKKLEWSGPPIWNRPKCPFCLRFRPDDDVSSRFTPDLIGHREDCELNAFLTGSQPRVRNRETDRPAPPEVHDPVEPAPDPRGTGL